MFMLPKRILILACLLALLSAVQSAGGDAPKNVLVFIGDGMGFEHVEAAGMYAEGAAGTLSFESLPFQAQITTYSANSAVTDSAAAGTAIATGTKVNNGVISMATPGDGSELETLLEYFSADSKRTGLVSTTYISHATPAAFGAHESSRNNYSAILSDYFLQSRPNVLFGGAKYLTPEAVESLGYTAVTDRAGMQALDTESVERVSGQFGGDHMPYEYDFSLYGTGYDTLPHLSEMTATALSILDNDTDGFFLMVEGGRIDHAAHSNQLERTVFETIEFANAVQVGLDWATGRDDTLIIVTADHETGGLSVLANNGAGAFPDVSWSTGTHTADDVPVYAWGANAELVYGTMDNTDLFAVATCENLAALPPDVNRSGDVGIGDLSILAGNWNQADRTWSEGDFNGDGFVGIGDLAIMAGYWGWTDPAGAPPASPLPEPATAVLLAAGAVALIRPRVGRQRHA